jgi:CRP-like cAMP-binding protein
LSKTAPRTIVAGRPHVSQGRTFQFQTNRILAALPPDEMARLAPHLRETPLPFKHSLWKPEQKISHVCFPDAGVCSVMSVMRNGRAAEVGTVGNEGVTGMALFFEDTEDPGECMVQVPGKGRLLPAAVFRQELARRGTFHRAVSQYAHAFMVQVMQSAACNQFHSLAERAGKWMLMTHDRVFTDEFKLTQEFLGMMLGANRPSVTLAALQLQHAGLIAYQRGNVTVLDRKGLERASCECYARVSTFFDRFLRRLSGG